MIVAFCFAGPGGNDQLIGSSQGNYGSWLANEIIPTSGNVEHQKEPAGIDDFKAPNKLHSPKVKTEAGVGRGEQAPDSTISDEVKDHDEVIPVSNKHIISAQLAHNFQYYRNAGEGDYPTMFLLDELEEITRLQAVYLKAESPQLKTKNDIQRYVRNYVLHALGKLNNNVSDLASGLSQDKAFGEIDLMRL
ncbi:hypothetical protein KEM48_004099 [Puccinia striiformis f. sp. tritici PST-130]|nr:hypothetical protein KEM48_004099 [Puccinia striiformis f. sp. tritici PST-130]